jgi:hypothetical protein
VSGIGSVGTGTFPNPVYPDAGIALSTGSAWASSIPNNSANWNVAFNDKINNAAFTGTTTKTLTLTQYDGGTFTPTFTDLQGVTGVTAGTGLTGGTITSTGTVAVDFTTVAPVANPTFTGTVSGITKSMVGLGNVDNTSDANKPISTATQTALNGKENTITAGTTGQYFRGDKTFQTLDKSAVGLGNVDNTSDANKPISTATQTALNLKVNISDTASMLTPYLRKADTSLLNLTSRFATKLNISDTASMLTNYLQSGVAASTYQTKLNGTGFVKASGTNITYDNSSYLTTGTAASTYQTILTNPVTGTGINDFIPKFTSTGSTIGNSVIQESSGNIGIGTTPIANLTFDVSKNILLKSGSTGIASILFSETGTPSSTDVEFGGILRYNGSLDRMELVTRDNLGGSNVTNTGITMDRITGNIGLLKPTTISSTLAVTGNITEAGNNVLTNLDTASLSSRIDSKYNSSGGTISGAVTLSTTSATPLTLLGKDGSNVVGTVTTVAQTGLFGRGSVTNAVTDSNGNITVAHGFNFTPIMAFANLPAQTANTVNVKSVDANNIVFVVRDGATFSPLNVQTVTKIEFFAIK